MISLLNLTDSQLKVYNRAIDFINDTLEKYIVITGSAGTGKTTLMCNIVKYILVNKRSQKVLLAAPTHKARKVIDNIVNKGLLFRVPSKTVASILSKQKDHTYIGTNRFSRKTRNQFQFNIVIVDESSMLTDSDVKEILELDAKIIFIGDDLQIPSPGQMLTPYTDPDTHVTMALKLPPIIFREESINRLETVVRNGDTLIELANLLKDIIAIYKTCVDINSAEDLLYKKYINRNIIDQSINTAHFIYVDKLDIGKYDFKKTKLICYKNESVKSYNIAIREKALGYTSEFVVGDILMGYNNCKMGTLIENGQDYIIRDISHTTSHRVAQFYDLVGYIIAIEEISQNHPKTSTIFIPSIYEEANMAVFNELVALATRVNRRESTKDDYIKYTTLKDELIFFSDIYMYNGSILSEREFQTAHNLLFTNVNEVISSNTVYDTKLAKLIDSKYKDIITDRINDKKIISENEKFADRYKVVNCDINYGYAITAHKSQGSTYENVIVDIGDFNLHNRYNHRMKMIENRNIEKWQLIYVASTRPSNLLIYYILNV